MLMQCYVRGGSRRRVQGVCTPPPPEMKLSLYLLLKLICLPHQSVTSFLRGAPPPKKNPGSAPVCSCEKSISRKKTSFSIEKFPSLVLPGNTSTVTAPYYPISSLLSVSGCLQEVKNKKKFHTFSSKSGRGCLWEVVAYKRFPMYWFGRKTFGKLVAEERWSQLKVRL